MHHLILSLGTQGGTSYSDVWQNLCGSQVRNHLHSCTLQHPVQPVGLIAGLGILQHKTPLS